VATALFARTDVLGFERMEYELTPEAIELGLGAALPAVFEIGKEREFGRGERSQGDDFDGSLAVRAGFLASPPGSPRLARAAAKPSRSSTVR